jgi:hypothetical protein
MAETFVCDWDGSSAVEIRHDDSHVEIRVAETEDGEDFLLVYLEPETARRFARAVTLASLAVEGEDVEAVRQAVEEFVDVKDTGYKSEPCPETNDGCDPLCSARSECRASAIQDLFREPDTEPVPYALVDEHADRADAFLAARDLAGPAANLDDVLKLAQYLEG